MHRSTLNPRSFVAISGWEYSVACGKYFFIVRKDRISDFQNILRHSIVFFLIEPPFRASSPFASRVCFVPYPVKSSGPYFRLLPIVDRFFREWSRQGKWNNRRSLVLHQDRLHETGSSLLVPYRCHLYWWTPTTYRLEPTIFLVLMWRNWMELSHSSSRNCMPPRWCSAHRALSLGRDNGRTHFLLVCA